MEHSHHLFLALSPLPYFTLMNFIPRFYCFPSSYRFLNIPSSELFPCLRASLCDSYIEVVLVRVTIAVVKYHEQRICGGKGLFHLILLGPSLRRVRAGTRAGQEPRGRSWWMVAAYWLNPHASLSLFSYSTQGHQPRGNTTHSELGPP